MRVSPGGKSMPKNELVGKCRIGKCVTSGNGLPCGKLREFGSRQYEPEPKIRYCIRYSAT